MDNLQKYKKWVIDEGYCNHSIRYSITDINYFNEYDYISMIKNPNLEDEYYRSRNYKCRRYSKYLAGINTTKTIPDKFIDELITYYSSNIWYRKQINKNRIKKGLYPITAYNPNNKYYNEFCEYFGKSSRYIRRIMGNIVKYKKIELKQITERILLYKYYLFVNKVK